MKEEEFIEKIKKYREMLVEQTDFFTERSKDKNASECGSHYDRGFANGFICARTFLEEIFDFWN